MIKNYFKIAWRNLWRHKRMTMINVAGLGIGMAATVLIVLWVQNELSFDKFQPDAQNIYRIKVRIPISKKETWVWENSQYVLGDFASRQIPEVADVARLKAYYSDLNMRYGAKIITEKKAAYVDGHWFKMFHYDFVDGSADAFLRNPFSLIITESAAKKYFGNQQAVGKVLHIDSNNYEVQAVIKDNPANSSFQYNLLIPIAAQLANAHEKKNALQWGNYNYLTFLKLKPGSNTALVANKLKSIVHQNKRR